MANAWFSAIALLLAAACSAGAAQKYEPSWDSLLQHKPPQWLIDAKFGIYAHWGVYAVPAFGNEWYAKRMYQPGDPVFEHHRKTYGPQSQFGYKDFIPMFRAERFDPDAWARLIKQSGARFAGIAVVHHDGFALWASDVSRWNVGAMGPKRDLYGDLVRALRRHGLKTMATFHHIRTFDWFLPTKQQDIERGRKEGWDIFDPRYADFYWNHYISKFEDFLAQWQARVKEVIDKYLPDVIWFDGGKFREQGTEPIALDVLAHYFNRAVDQGKEVEVLNKLPVSLKFNFPREFGVLTFEEGRDRPPIVDRPWIDDMKISTRSWGYIEGQEYRSPDEIIDGLVDRVSRGGGLVLNLSPKADGTIPQAQQDILREIGRWLELNGEAIYATRPWKIHAEGSLDKVRRKKGKHWRWVFDSCDASDIRFTTRGNTLYAIALGWPADGKLRIASLRSGEKVSSGGIAEISLLGSPGKLKWSRDEQALTVWLPQERPCQYAYVLKIAVRGELATN